MIWATDGVGDLGEALAGEGSGGVNDEFAGHHDLFLASLAREIGFGNQHLLTDAGDDRAQGDWARAALVFAAIAQREGPADVVHRGGAGRGVPMGIRRRLGSARLVHQAGDRLDLDDRAFEIADGRALPDPDTIDDGLYTCLIEHHAFVGRDLRDEPTGEIVVRVFDLDDQPSGEARSQRLVEPGDLAGVGIGCEDDRAPAQREGVEDLEEFVLGRLLASHQVDVVDAQQLEPAELLGKGFYGTGADRGDEPVGECFAGGVANLASGSDGSGVVGRAPEEVCFAHAA